MSESELEEHLDISGKIQEKQHKIPKESKLLIDKI
jgi:hypothetical protein